MPALAAGKCAVGAALPEVLKRRRRPGAAECCPMLQAEWSPVVARVAGPLGLLVT